MARSDLLITLVKASTTGDKKLARSAIEAMIAEARAKQHNILAKKLEEILYSFQFESTKNDNFLFGKKTNDLVQEIEPNKNLDDLIFPYEVIQICNELIQEQFRADLLRSYNMEPRNRILLIGPPGNGKTSLAEAIAHSLMVPLLVVRYESIIGSYLGETAIKIRNLIEYACTRKCVLFFDEFETLGKERGDINETGEIKRVVSSLLLQIDSLPSHVIVVGATNHPELLDRAVWRRFQVRLEIPMPTVDKLIEWLAKFENKTKFSFDYSIENLAKKMDGWNFSEVEEFGNTVLRKYILEKPSLSKVKNIVSQTLSQWEFRPTSFKQNLIEI